MSRSRPRSPDRPAQHASPRDATQDPEPHHERTTTSECPPRVRGLLKTSRHDAAGEGTDVSRRAPNRPGSSIPCRTLHNTYYATRSRNDPGWSWNRIGVGDPLGSEERCASIGALGARSPDSRIRSCRHRENPLGGDAACRGEPARNAARFETSSQRIENAGPVASGRGSSRPGLGARNGEDVTVVCRMGRPSGTAWGFLIYLFRNPESANIAS